MKLRAVREFEHQDQNAPFLLRVFPAESGKSKKPHSLLKIQTKQGVG